MELSDGRFASRVKQRLFCIMLAKRGASALSRKALKADQVCRIANARLLSKSLEATGWYRCVSDIHRPKGQHEYKKGEIAPTKDGETSADYNAGLPVVAFCLTDEFKAKYPHVKQASVSNLLRAKQYIIPSESPSCPP